MPDAPERMNDSGTCSPTNAESVQDRSAFDPVDIRRGLIARRVREGATSEDGYTCSNLVEQLQILPGYVRPEWAKDERQTWPWLIQQQMRRFGLPTVTTTNGERQ